MPSNLLEFHWIIFLRHIEIWWSKIPLEFSGISQYLIFMVHGYIMEEPIRISWNFTSSYFHGTWKYDEVRFHWISWHRMNVREIYYHINYQNFHLNGALNSNTSNITWMYVSSVIIMKSLSTIIRTTHNLNHIHWAKPQGKVLTANLIAPWDLICKHLELLFIVIYFQRSNFLYSSDTCGWCYNICSKIVELKHFSHHPCSWGRHILYRLKINLFKGCNDHFVT